MDTADRRRFKRYSLYCPVEYRCEDDSPIESSITLNLSEGGALISTNRLLAPDSRLIVKIPLKDETFFVRGRVVHVESGKEEGLHSVGVEFLQNPFNFIHKFYEELEAIMLFQRQYSKEALRPLTLAEASMKWHSFPSVVI